MRNIRRRLLATTMFTILLVVLSGCGNSSPGEVNKLPTTDQISTETASDEAEGSSSSDNEIINSQKEDYLKKLNEMEEADRNSEVGTTMLELEQQEAERYKKWDDELNQIYGILQDQLSTERMDEVREEQRDWIKYRDETAKESSLKYEGGSTESLEYVAALASLTRERCYVLVAKYMN